ncbi:MAG TPA: hypothetical protein VH139_10845, partial [Acidobacteriaceae bacterium]|nr:hypothetical protein [Acidobacteriaceae bacterium]
MFKVCGACLRLLRFDLTSVLPIAAATTEVVVRPTEVIAEEQMKAEERQRVFGIVPQLLYELHLG